MSSFLSRICQNAACSKSFLAPKHKVAEGKGRFCSKSCATRAAQQSRRVLVPFTCQNPACSRSFGILPSERRRGKKYCSLACAHQVRERPLHERFWPKVQLCVHGRLCPYCCWPWQAATNTHGYGMLSVEIEGQWKPTLAHIVGWELLNQQNFPKPLFGLHHCDTPACCNGMHIYPGTQCQNVADMHARNRHARGNDLPQTKLHPEDIPVIFQRHAGGWTRQQIAQSLLVTPAAIGDVLHFKNWHHVSSALTVAKSSLNDQFVTQILVLDQKEPHSV